ncbi:C-terminal binding protein [Jiangella endophytica]|uniref:C-terminal binding protein n=1 Tax=Jiangella endophytica TaxID=1623398 RepID=UPI0013005988|nr:C-terminal binding protein [Jiangella endophytica]
MAILDCDFGRGEIESEILAGAGYACRIASANSEDDAMSAADGAVGLLTQYAPVTAAVLDAAPTVRAVVRYGVGLDVIDLHAAKRRSVAVSGVADYCTDEVADHALALILSVTRDVAGAAALVRAGTWPPPADLRILATLSSMTAGVVGFGRIGRAVAQRLSAFGARVVICDAQIDDQAIRAAGYKPMSLDDTFRASNIVSLHLPATTETWHLVNRSRLALMPPGAVVVNTSRAALIDEPALQESLVSGHLAAAALDVVETNEHSSIAHLDQVIVTPHVAYYSPDSLRQLRSRAASTLVDLLDARPSAKQA